MTIVRDGRRSYGESENQNYKEKQRFFPGIPAGRYFYGRQHLVRRGHVTSKSGIPLSLDREEYELYQEEEEPRREIDQYSYHLGAMDSFCEMVAAGVKKLAMSHPCATRRNGIYFCRR